MELFLFQHLQSYTYIHITCCWPNVYRFFFTTSGSGNTVFGQSHLPVIVAFLLKLPFPFAALSRFFAKHETFAFSLYSFFFFLHFVVGARCAYHLDQHRHHTKCVSNRVYVFEATANDIVTKLNYCFIDTFRLPCISCSVQCSSSSSFSSYIAFNLFCIFFFRFERILFFISLAVLCYSQMKYIISFVQREQINSCSH